MSDYCTTCGRCQGCGQHKPLANDLASGAYMAAVAPTAVVVLPTAAAGNTLQVGCAHLNGVVV